MYEYICGVAHGAYAPRMPRRQAVILSPHLDDAVLSCWHLLSGRDDVAVINVFAGTPPPGSGPTWWDRLSGATDSVLRMEERRAEDREAFAIAGRSAIDLDFLDDQYEPTNQPIEAIVSRLRELIDPRAVVYAPAALGEHRDHESVRNAALELAASGQRVRLYADHPHAVQRGWPTWIDGTETETGRDVAAHWDRRLSDAGVEQPPQPAVHHLSAAEQKRKLRAVSAYRTQIRALGSTFGEIEGFPAFPYEVVWNVS